MKVVRQALSKITEGENGTLLYCKGDGSPQIEMHPANQARARLGHGFHRNHADDTDDLPSEVMNDNRRHEPLVCAPAALGGSYLAGYLDRDRDVLVLCEYPVTDASHAARCAHRMAEQDGIDAFDLVNNAEPAAA